MCAVDFGEAWEVHKKTKPQLNPAEADANAMAIEISPQVADAGAIAISSTDTSSNKERYHEGFLLNLGQKVQCLAWAPSDANSSFQYLAVSCAHTSTQSSSGTLPATLASSLGPSPPIPSSIQIWAFKSTGHAPHIPAKLDVTTKPKLVQVLCTDWGYIRQILWCPVPREIRTSINDNEPLSREEWLGLLGIVTSDGFAAVLDVTIPLPTPDVEAQYLHVSSPAFAVSPPSPAICTGLAFASTSDFIIATCTGAVSIYNVTDSTALGATEPRLSYQLENTDVCAISNAYPSPHPTILASASASGSLSLTDLYRPSQENASANKPCDPPLHLTYSPLAQTFITTSGGDVKLPSILTCHSMQHFTIGTNITRVPSERPVTALASSKWHPGILFGTADGSVFSTNYLRRLIPQAQVTDSSGAFIQKLCEYEWIVTEPTANFSQMDFNRQPPEQLGGGRSSSIAKTALPTHQERGSNVAECLHIEASVPSAGDTRPGRSRFHEGFQAERVDITQPMPGKKGQNPITETVFQEEQGVAAVDWNPNLSCAGWLAVAWGSGLVRVQDVARGT
jgi:transcription factor C subunit 6